MHSAASRSLTYVLTLLTCVCHRCLVTVWPRISHCTVNFTLLRREWTPDFKLGLRMLRAQRLYSVVNLWLLHPEGGDEAWYPWPLGPFWVGLHTDEALQAERDDEPTSAADAPTVLRGVQEKQNTPGRKTGTDNLTAAMKTLTCLWLSEKSGQLQWMSIPQAPHQ